MLIRVSHKKNIKSKKIIWFELRNLQISLILMEIGLDYFVKDRLKIKYYVRYMNVFVMFVHTKEGVRKVIADIGVYLEENLHLQLNHKSGYHPNKMGLDFCGFRVYESYRLLRKRSIKKIKRKIKRWNILYENNLLDLHKTILEWNSWLAHSSHAKCYKL